MDLAREDELLDFSWINGSARRARTLPDDAGAVAEAWRAMGDTRRSALDKVRRRVSKLLVETKAQQMPTPGSREAAAPAAIYAYYDGRKPRFEALAQIVAERAIAPHLAPTCPVG